MLQAAKSHPALVLRRLRSSRLEGRGRPDPSPHPSRRRAVARFATDGGLLRMRLLPAVAAVLFALVPSALAQDKSIALNVLHTLASRLRGTGAVPAD